MLLAVIPARGGSKRIEFKNIVNFCGKPLICYSLDLARQFKQLDHIHISTEDPSIEQTVKSYGHKIDFTRDPKLADDHTGIMPVLKWVLDKFKQKGKIFTDVCLIMPTAPLILLQDLEIAYEQYLEHDKQFPTMACSTYPAPIEWAFSQKEDRLIEPLDSSKLDIRSQDLKTHYFDSGSFSFLSADHIHNGIGDKYIPYILPRERAVDIDDFSDLQLAELLYLGRIAKARQ